MSHEELFETYKRVFEDQGSTFEARSDPCISFCAGRVPNLRLVVVTSETYRLYYLSLQYLTPTIRSFSLGFNHPLPSSTILGRRL